MISDLQYSGNEDFNAFYTKFRSTVCNNLKKQARVDAEGVDFRSLMLAAVSFHHIMLYTH